jgi:multidrug resistance efflux pump
MKDENCNVDDMNWEQALMEDVLAGVEEGIEDAKKELERRQRLFEEDTISAKALDQSAITIEWIEE